VSVTTDVATYLATIPALGLTAGTNLFDIPFPESAQSQAVCLIDTPGSEDEHAAGASLSRPLYETPRFQVVCRDAEDKAATAKALARSIRLNLNRLAATTLGDTRVLTMKSLQPPFYISVDGQNRHRWVTNYEAVIQDVGST
jgi:hypothetical protein